MFEKKVHILLQLIIIIINYIPIAIKINVYFLKLQLPHWAVNREKALQMPKTKFWATSPLAFPLQNILTDF